MTDSAISSLLNRASALRMTSAAFSFRIAVAAASATADLIHDFDGVAVRYPKRKRINPGTRGKIAIRSR